MTSGRPWLTHNVLGVFQIHLQLVWVALSTWTDRPQEFSVAGLFRPKKNSSSRSPQLPPSQWTLSLLHMRAGPEHSTPLDFTTTLEDLPGPGINTNPFSSLELVCQAESSRQPFLGSFSCHSDFSLAPFGLRFSFWRAVTKLVLGISAHQFWSILK